LLISLLIVFKSIYATFSGSFAPQEAQKWASVGLGFPHSMQKFPVGCSGWGAGGMEACAETAGDVGDVGAAWVTGAAVTTGVAEAGGFF